jgi:hypothetical protein
VELQFQAAPASGAAAAAAAASDGDVYLLPVWHPRRLTMAGAASPQAQASREHPHEPQHGHQALHEAGGGGAAEPLGPWRYTPRTPTVFNGMGSHLFRSTATGRLRQRFQSAVAAATAAAEQQAAADQAQAEQSRAARARGGLKITLPVGFASDFDEGALFDETTAAATASGGDSPGSAGGGGAGVSGNRAVGGPRRTFTIDTPAQLREVGRRLREERLLKVYGRFDVRFRDESPERERDTAPAPGSAGAPPSAQSSDGGGSAGSGSSAGTTSVGADLVRRIRRRLAGASGRFNEAQTSAPAPPVGQASNAAAASAPVQALPPPLAGEGVGEGARGGGDSGSRQA